MPRLSPGELARSVAPAPVSLRSMAPDPRRAARTPHHQRLPPPPSRQQQKYPVTRTLVLLPTSYVHGLLRRRPWAALRHTAGGRAHHHWPIGATTRMLLEGRFYPSWLATTSHRLRDSAAPGFPSRRGGGSARSFPRGPASRPLSCLPDCRQHPVRRPVLPTTLPGHHPALPDQRHLAHLVHRSPHPTLRRTRLGRSRRPPRRRTPRHRHLPHHGRADWYGVRYGNSQGNCVARCDRFGFGAACRCSGRCVDVGLAVTSCPPGSGTHRLRARC